MTPLFPDDQRDWNLRALTCGRFDATAVCLRFCDPDACPDTITELLGIEPSAAMRRAEIPAGSLQHPSWVLSGPREIGALLEHQIGDLLFWLPEDPLIWMELARLHGEILCSGWMRDWNRECLLTPELLGRIADRYLYLRFDIRCEASSQDHPEDDT